MSLNFLCLIDSKYFYCGNIILLCNVNLFFCKIALKETDNFLNQQTPELVECCGNKFSIV